METPFAITGGWWQPALALALFLLAHPWIIGVPALPSGTPFG